MFGSRVRKANADLLYQRAPGPGAVSVAWFGTTCLLISDGVTALLVDPFVTRSAGLLALATGRRVLAPDPDQYDRWIAPLGAPIRAMPVTHGHFDHVLDAGVVAARTGAALLGSPTAVMIGRSLGVPAKQLRTAEPEAPMRYGAFTVTFVHSEHSGRGGPVGEVLAPLRLPARLGDLRQGGTYSVLIAHPLGALLCHHSAGYRPGALAGHRADVAFLSIAAPPSDRDAYLRETVDAVGAARVFLVHWDHFGRPLDRRPRQLPLRTDLAGFAADLRRRRPGLVVHTLPIGTPQAVLG